MTAPWPDVPKPGTVPKPRLDDKDDPVTTPPRRSWSPVDLTSVLDGSYSPPTPTVGRRADGVGLFYPGRVHSIASESEGGKTWLALAAAATELAAGNATLYLDFEDDEGGVVSRLLAIGADTVAIRDRFAYLRPEEPLDIIGTADLAAAIGDLRPTLAVVDGVTEAMTLHGLELKDNSDVAKFGKILTRRIASVGPAVVALDHVIKSAEGRGRYAIGGAHKLNGLNGAAFVLENRQPFGHGVAGRSTVYISKDRPGQLRRHALPGREGLTWFADLVVESHPEGFVEATLTVPVHHEKAFRPTVLMARVCEALGRAGPLNGRGITDRVRGKAQDIRSAIAVLIDEGYITVATGARGAQLHTLVKPFEEAA